MRYEIDFIATKENKGNTDAICFRYEKDGKFINVVYDGGSKVLANKLIEHLEEFYFKNEYYPKIDYLICSHPDQDHASGLIEVIEKFEIDKIIMNIPWKYIYDIWDNVNDGRVSEESLENRLKDDYPYVAQIEKLAEEKGIEIEKLFIEDMVDFDFLDDADAFIVATYTYGEGELPEEMEEFFEALSEKDFSGKIYGVIGTGDTVYEQYCVCVDQFNEQIAQTGATNPTQNLKIEIEADTDEDFENIDKFIEDFSSAL